jgi:MOSC domain-containing protein YiiM
VGTTKGRVRAISISKEKGIPKTNVPEADLQAGLGVVGDVHADGGHRQVSLLAAEEIDRLRKEGASVSPGEFAENITTQGLDLRALKVGSKLRIGGNVELVVTQLGKQCHGRCAIFERLGDCIMPREGIFARVTASGRVNVGDTIELIMDDG